MSEATEISADVSLDELDLTDKQRKSIEDGKEKIAELRTAGALVLVLSTGEIVGFKKLDRITWKQFKQKREDEKQKHLVDEWLSIALAVHPSKDAFDRILDDKPARSAFFMGKILEANGLDKDEAKKL